MYNIDGLACFPGALGHPLSETLRLAWAAGFIDGEGCLSVVRQVFKSGRRPTFRIKLDIMQNDLIVLQSLQAILKEHSKIYRVKRKVAHNKQLWALKFDGEHALRAIARVSPFLVRKGPEAQVLLHSVKRCAWGLHSGPRGFDPEVWAERERVCNKLQRLK